MTSAPNDLHCLQHTFLCMDCADTRGLCSLCHRDHVSCRTLQIRRYVYRDVVKVADIQPYYDTSGIQSYTVNHSQAIFLSSKDKAPVGPYYRVDSSACCETCKRGLRSGCTFCSLACKVRVCSLCSWRIFRSSKLLCPQPGAYCGRFGARWSFGQ
jgi:hypothetical protein